MITISELFSFMATEGLPILCLTPGTPPFFKKNGKTSENPKWDLNLSERECQRLVLSVMTEKEHAVLAEQGYCQAEIRLKTFGRFRIEAQSRRGIVSATVYLLYRDDLRRECKVTRIILSKSALGEIKSRLAQTKEKAIIPWVSWGTTHRRLESDKGFTVEYGEGWHISLVPRDGKSSPFIQELDGIEIGANEPELSKQHITELNIDFQNKTFVFNGELGV